jgi:hypothetical protein
MARRLTRRMFVTGNTPSLELQKKLGYTISEDTIVWLHK